MSDLVHIESGGLPVSRRDLLRGFALAATLGSLGEADAQHVHQMASDERHASGGTYAPKAFNAHQYATLQRLSELIVPADEHGPSALEVGAADFIDLLSSNNDELKAIYTNGIAWLDQASESRAGKPFVDAPPAAQGQLLDQIAYRKNSTPDLTPGIEFFSWVRKMVVDAYYTSKAGTEGIGYKGNVGVAVFKTNREALAYALKRSPV